MQEVRHCELLPGSTLAQSQAMNQVREGCTLPSSPCGNLWRDATSALPTTSPHVDAHILAWLTPLPAPLLVRVMPPRILLSNYSTGPVGSPRCVAAAHGSYHFGDPRFTTLRRLLTPNLLGSAAHLRSPHTGWGHSQAGSSFGAFAQTMCRTRSKYGVMFPSLSKNLMASLLTLSQDTLSALCR